ncbi:MAG TPA: FAD-binding protein [Gammaproteobacteria bacterium]|nr:FAD-binding protein [Gammaproteobacteria bacterium]
MSAGKQAGEVNASVGDKASVVVIGAGPAGMTAAINLAKQGVRCTVFDENSSLGGVIHCGPSRDPGKVIHLDKKIKQNIESIRSEYEKYSDYITLNLSAQVMGATHRQLAFLRQKQFKTIDFDYLVISTGCYEKATPFPGWTLPGVMTLGGAQLQVKNGLVRPGQRAVLVGTGPLLPVAAVQLQKAGVNVAGVYESGRRIDLAKNIFSLFNNIPLLKQGLGCLNALRNAGIPFRYGWGLVEARGSESLEQVVLAPYDNNWRPVTEKQEVVAADCLGVGYGFSSRTQLTQLLGLEHRFERGNEFVPVCDEWGRTSLQNVFVAGDAGTVNGAQIALEQGKLAAIAVLMDLGKFTSGQARLQAARIRKTTKKYIRFSKVFAEFSRMRPGLLDLPDKETIVCRCENVTKGQIDEAIEQGVSDITTLKMVTRVGMGDCQGKVCSNYCYGRLRQQLGKDDVGELRPRFPLSPLSFDALSDKEVSQ